MSPTSSEGFAQAHERLQARQLVLNELIAGRVQRLLRFEQGQEIHGASLIP